MRMAGRTNRHSAHHRSFSNLGLPCPGALAFGWDLLIPVATFPSLQNMHPLHLTCLFPLPYVSVYYIYLSNVYIISVVTFWILVIPACIPMPAVSFMPCNASIHYAQPRHLPHTTSPGAHPWGGTFSLGGRQT